MNVHILRGKRRHVNLFICHVLSRTSFLNNPTPNPQSRQWFFCEVFEPCFAETTATSHQKEIKGISSSSPQFRLLNGSFSVKGLPAFGLLWFHTMFSQHHYSPTIPNILPATVLSVERLFYPFFLKLGHTR